MINNWLEPLLPPLSQWTEDSEGRPKKKIIAAPPGKEVSFYTWSYLVTPLLDPKIGPRLAKLLERNRFLNNYWDEIKKGLFYGFGRIFSTSYSTRI